VFRKVQRPRQVDEQRVAALRFEDVRVQSLLHALVLYRLQPRGFSNADLREQHSSLRHRNVSPGSMTYDLRRLRLHGLIRRIDRTRRYEVTDQGLRIALYFTRVHDRLMRPGLSLVVPDHVPNESPLRTCFRKLEFTMNAWVDNARLTA
jgi:DNA-binding PadR family transcriptional regulator